VAARSTESRGVVAFYKTPTTANVTSAITTAVRKVLEISKVPLDEILCLVIGTTSFINAVVEQDARRLKKVGILRLSKSFLREIPPFSEFPPGLAKLCDGYIGYVDGGLAIDGSEESPVREGQVVEHCRKLKELDIKSIVIAGVFSPIDETFHQEDSVREVVLRELPEADVVCSHKVANIGFKERENASILNASMLHFARRTIRAFKTSMQELKLTCPLYLTQNDGTIVDAASAMEYPIKTFSSGATNSMRGAAYLAGPELDRTKPTIVVDMGGTTSDVGVLEKSGFPRQAPAYVSIAGVTVNYSLPLVHSIGLGGGSIVRDHESGVTVGPDSVGFRLESESRVFGGKKLTATDVSVAAGKAFIGNKDLVSEVTFETTSKSEAVIRKSLEDAIDVVKTSPEPLPVLLVGGGAIIAPAELKGASKIVRPLFHDVANAVGAATSKVGGTVDIVQSTAKQTVAEAVEHAKKLAVERAEASGAEPKSVTIADVDSIPLQYVTNQVRTIVRAVGDLDNAREGGQLADVAGDIDLEEYVIEEADKVPAAVFAVPNMDLSTYRPNIQRNKGGHLEWNISETDLQFLATGMYVLGCAGGGNPESTRVMLRDQLRAGYSMRVIDTDSLAETSNIYWGGHMGSPAVSVERLASIETVEAVKVLMEYLQHDQFDAIMGLEIGGANGLEPFLLGSSKYFDRPVIDADWMGRAYPTYWQTTLAAYKSGELVPCAIDSGDGNSIIMTRASTDEIVDRALRGSCSEMGSRVGMCARPTTGARVKGYGVINSCSLAWRIGRCIAIAQATNTVSMVAESIISEVGGSESSKILFRGKITSVERRLHKGHSYGEVVIGSTAREEAEMEAVVEGGTLRIPFKNENIIAEHDNDGEKRVIASVPDLIAVLDAGTGRALGVPEYRYGVQVVVLGIACSPHWTESPLGLKIGGPQAFGFDTEYRALGVYREPKSVLAEFGPR
jgi:DUF917 family protein/N-methylhydantoinase A/oxoprolinase/acetone carboxylase beta subunit